MKNMKIEIFQLVDFFGEEAFEDFVFTINSYMEGRDVVDVKISESVVDGNSNTTATVIYRAEEQR